MTKNNLSSEHLFSVSGCLTENALTLFAHGKLSDSQHVEVEKHIYQCEMCKDSLEGYSLWMQQNLSTSKYTAGSQSIKASPQFFASRTAMIRERIRLRVDFHKQVASVKNNRKTKKSFPWMATAATVILFLAVFYIVRVQNIFDKNKLAESTQSKSNAPQELMFKIDTSPEKSEVIAQQIPNLKPQKKQTVAGSIKQQEELSIIENDDYTDGVTRVLAPLASSTATEKSNPYAIQPKETITELSPLSDKEEIAMQENKAGIVTAETIEKEALEEKEVKMLEGVKITSKAERAKKTDEVYVMVEKQPMFPGGEVNLQKFLSENVQYPSFAKENGIEGTVVVSFVVRKNGKLTDIKVVKSLGGGCDEQAIAAVKAMPRWIPGEQSGRKVDVRFNLPIVFKIK